MSVEKAKELNLKPLAKIRSYAVQINRNGLILLLLKPYPLP